MNLSTYNVDIIRKKSVCTEIKSECTKRERYVGGVSMKIHETFYVLFYMYKFLQKFGQNSDCY
jgi:hypothetical protein